MRIGMTRQAQRSQEKRQHIYQVAMELFMKYGYNQTTVRDICRAAGITNGTFYHFFGEKYDILGEYHRSTLEKISYLLEPTAERLDSPFRSVYQYCLAATDLFDYCGKELMRDIMNMPKRDSMETQVSEQEAVERICRFLEQAKAVGTVPRDFDTWHAAEHILITNSGMLLYWITVDTKETFHQLAQRILPRLFRAYTDGVALEERKE